MTTRSTRSTRPIRPLSFSLARLSSTVAIAAALSLAGASRVDAAILDWDPAGNLSNSGGTGIWNTTSLFWNNAGVDQSWVNANIDTAQFGGTGGVVTLTTGIDAGGLNFTTDGYNITGNTLTLVGATPTIDVAIGATATISSTLAGTAGATVTGGGTLLLTQANSITGTWDILAGTVRASNFGALGTGPALIGVGATLEYNAGGGNLTTPLILNGGTFRQIPQADLVTQAVINVTAPSTLDMSSGANFGKIFVNAGITGSGDLTKNGNNGILQIVQSNLSYTGNWTLNGGYIEAQNPTALGTGSVTVHGGELVASNNPIPNPVTIGTAGATLSVNNGNFGIFTGTIDAAQNFNFGLRDFYNLGQSRNGAVSGVISGPGAMNILNPSAVSQLTLTGNNSAWSGGITVPSNVQLRAAVGGAGNALGTGPLIVNGSLFVITTPNLVAGANSGFSGRYYNSALLGNGVIGGFDYGLYTPIAVRNEEVIDLANGTGTIVNPPIPGFNIDHNGELWTGILEVTAPGSYTFFTSSDDGSLLYLDGQQLVQNDYAQGVTERSGVATLTTGFHSVIVKFGQGTGGGGMHAHYRGPDTSGVQMLIGAIPGTVTNDGQAVLGSNTITQDINLGATGTGGFDLAGSNTTVTGALLLQNSIPVNITGVTGHELLTQSGPVTLNGAHTITMGINQILNGIQFGSAGADMLISGNIGEGTAGSGITKTGPRTLTLSGTNTYTGPTTVINGVLQLNSPVPNSGVGPGGLVINPTAGNVVIRLLTDEQMPDGSDLAITGSGNNGALFDANGFTETVGGINFTGVGATATGALTGATGTLKITGDILLNNNRPAANNTGREVLISSTGTYTTAVPGGGALDLGGVLRNITVETTNTGPDIPGSDATIEANIINGGINKLGSRTLILNGENSYAGGTTIAAGAVRAAGVSGDTSTALGTGLVTLNGGSLELRNNGTGNNGTITYGNNVLIHPSQSAGGFDVANNGANTGNTIALGNLAIGAQTLNLTGANNYAVRFNSVTLSGNATVNPTTATLSLANVGESGGSYSLTKSASSPGVLTLSGAGTYTGGTTVPTGSGPLRIVPSIGSPNTPAGTGAITLGTGTTLQITPTITTLTGAGATQGVLLARFYTGGTTIAGGDFFALPTASTTVSLLSDGTFFNRPAVITPASATNLLAVYSGLLNITTAGDYSFQTAVQDGSQLVIDGVPVISVNTTSGTQALIDSATSAPLTLGAGFHTISMKVFNGGNGGGFRVRYTGPDTADSLQVIPSSKLYNAPALLNVGNAGAAVSLAAAATVTLDGIGSELDSSVTGLTLGSGSTLNVTNSGGLGALSVAGITTLQGPATINTTAAALHIIGDLADGGGNHALAKNGAGTLILSGAKTFGGTLTINAGGVQVNNPASLGGTAGGTIVANNIVPLVSTTTTASRTVTVASTGLVVGAFVTGTGIPAGTTIAAIPNATSITLSANATAGGSPSLTYTFGGTLDLNGTALGAEPLTLSGGGSTTSPAALYNSSATAASVSGPVTIGSAGTRIGGYGDLTIGSIIGGAAANDLTKTGGNTLNLNGANTFSGAFTVSQGIVKIGDNAALGANTAGTTVTSGATLDLNGRTITEPLNIGGAGFVNQPGANSLGALINTAAGPASTSANIVLSAAANIGSSSLTGGGAITVGGVISGGFALNKVGGNTLTLTGVNTFTVGGTVQLGTLILSGAGTIANTTGTLSLNPTTTLTLDNTGTNTASRLGIGQNLTFRGASFNILGNAAASTVQDIATKQLVLDAHHSVITLTPGSGTANVRFNATGVAAGLARSNSGTALFRGTGLGTGAIGAGGIASITFGGAIPTTGQAGATGTKNRAIVPWALVDTSATGTGTSFAAYSATNGLQALQAREFDTTLVANNNIITGSALTAASGTTSINSLTLNTGGGVTIGTGNTLNLASGGILATANATIGGAGSLTGPALGDILLHTPVAGTTLTISSVIGGTRAFTKTGAGTLRLTGASNYTGTVRLNGGTTTLAAGANTIPFPSTTPPAVGAVASTYTTNNFFVDTGATLDLNGNDQRVGGLSSNGLTGTGTFPGTFGTITNSGAMANFRFARVGTGNIVPTVIAGNINIQRDGLNTITVTSPWTYNGTTTLTGGVLSLQDAGALTNTTAVAIRRAVLRIDNTQLQAATRINPAATIGLDGGAISFLSRSGGTQDSLNLGATSLNSGASVILQNLGGGGTAATGSSTINIASLTRSQGATLNLTATANNNVQLGDNPRVLLGTGTPTLTNGLVGGWATTQGYNSANPASGNAGFDFASYDPATGFRPTSYSTSFAENENTNYEPLNAANANNFLSFGGATVNSLRIGGLGTTTSTTIGFGSDTDVLNIQTGGILGVGNIPRAIADSANFGQLTAGGSASSGTRELFIHNAANTLFINAQIVDNPNGALVALVLDGLNQTSTIQLNGSNSYSGTTYANGVTVTLFSPGLAIPGNLVINGGTTSGSDSGTAANQTVRLLASDQIAPSASVTVNGGGLLNLNGFNNTLANVTLTADGGSFGGQGASIQTGTGVLTLTGSITATNLLQASTIPFISGNLDLPAGAHNVAIGTVAGAPGQVGLQLNATLTGTGSLNVTSGVLGLGNTVNTTDINLAAGSTLNVTNISTITPITPTIGTLTGSGNVTISLASTAQAQLVLGNDDGSGTYSGTITAPSPAGITKVGTGTQTISAAQSYGALTVNGGTLALGARNTLAALTIGTGALARMTAHTGGPGNVKPIDTASLTLGGTGTLDLTNNAMVVRGGSLAAITAAIDSGSNGLSWDGAGINSSTAFNDPNFLTGIGVINNAEYGYTDFANVTGLTGAEILVKYTYYGDSDLSGQTTADDFTLFFDGFTGAAPASWLYGDYDYDGAVTVDDFTLFVSALNSGAPALAPDGGASMGGGEGGGTPAAVPEPGSIALLLAGAAALLRRRR